MSLWIDGRNITEGSYNRLTAASDAKDFQIAFLVDRLNQMLCAESKVVRDHVSLSLSDHQANVELFECRKL